MGDFQLSIFAAADKQSPTTRAWRSWIDGVSPITARGISAKTLDLYEGSLWGTNYLIEGVIGSIT